MTWKWARPSDKQPSADEWVGFLDRGVRLEGTLELAGTFRLEAQVKGNIISSSRLLLGEEAHAEGQIEGNQVVIAGRFNGVIFAKGRVEIQPKGVVTGEIHTPCLLIEPGGIFDGRCHMLASSAKAKSLTIPFRAIHQA
ncbi:MAG TPA: polymer-forming cytoskeletal protein [Candidatus Acidoferrales bacterium]|nr:polymer-forming cytoskeletal protein [Candidatus Acidoferrales bacterium]